ncbi:Hypothetical predicted protein, partial [Olea europaea subsp. europaea]
VISAIITAAWCGAVLLRCCVAIPSPNCENGFSDAGDNDGNERVCGVCSRRRIAREIREKVRYYRESVYVI